MIDGWYGFGWLESTVNLTWLYRVGCFHESIHPAKNFVSTNTSICSLEKPTRISSTFWERFGTPEVFFYHALLRWIFRVLGNGGMSFILSPPKWWQRCTWHKLLIADIRQLACSTLPTTFYQTKQNPVTTLILTATWSWLIYRTLKLR